MPEGKYPFVFIGHGELDPDYIDKCEELYIWFKQPVKPENRKDIMKTCPPPLAGFFHWADEFVHFGSADDTYDFNITSSYCPEESKNIFDGTTMLDNNFWNSEQFWQMTLYAQKEYQKDLDRWILGVNSIAPIAFFIGPNRAGAEDEWNRWSIQNIDSAAVPYLADFINKSAELFANDFGDEQRSITDIAVKGIDSWVGVMDQGQVKYIFGFIARALLNYNEYSSKKLQPGSIETASLLELTEAIISADGIYEPFSTLSYADSTIKTNASRIDVIMKNFDESEKFRQLSLLKPYSQLVYYSAMNTTSAVLAAQKDPVNILRNILAGISSERKNATASFVVFLANNLVKIGPAYEVEYDFTNLKLASEIMELSFDMPMVTAEAFINGAFFFDNLGNYDKMLEASLKGNKLYPDNSTITSNILYAAQKLGKPEIAEKYMKESEDLALTDPLLLLNHTYSLLQKGESNRVKELVALYISKGGKLTPELLSNIMYLYTVDGFDDGKRDMFLNALMNFINIPDKKNDKFRTNPDLICNATIVLNNLNRVNDSLTLINAFKQSGGTMTPGLYNQAIYIAVELRDENKLNDSLDNFLMAYNDFKPYFDGHAYAFASASNVYAIRKDANNTIKYLQIAKKKGFDISYVRAEKDYEFLLKNKDFEKLFK